ARPIGRAAPRGSRAREPALTPPRRQATRPSPAGRARRRACSPRRSPRIVGGPDGGDRADGVSDTRSARSTRPRSDGAGVKKAGEWGGAGGEGPMTRIIVGWQRLRWRIARPKSRSARRSGAPRTILLGVFVGAGGAWVYRNRTGRDTVPEVARDLLRE